MTAVAVAPVDEVALVHWPAQASIRRALATEGRARLLLVAPDAQPPQLWDPLEDWVRTPADPIELYARRGALERRQAGRAPAFLDADGLLHRSRAWVALSPTETALVRLLLDRLGRVVARRELLAAAGATARPEASRTLDRAIHRLRRRLEPLGVVIHTVRSTGFVLTVDEAPGRG